MRYGVSEAATLTEGMPSHLGGTTRAQTHGRHGYGSANPRDGRERKGGRKKERAKEREENDWPVYSGGGYMAGRGRGGRRGSGQRTEI